tara:strand:+ start:21482 stop:22687 length:1206 start_codon:yes stop_codon:yes gene_type:complete
MSLSEEVTYLLSPKAVRERTGLLYEKIKSGEGHFSLHEEKLGSVCDYVLEVIKENYPDLDIPFHSRWGHFKVGDIDRNKMMNEKISSFDAFEKARIKLDLVITSVLLDAGAGATWKYQEEKNTFSRSEGLAVASWHMFFEGKFSENQSYKAESSQLIKLQDSDIEEGFQVSEANPLIGVGGRTGLLKSLGNCVAKQPDAFKDGRPGNILDYMKDQYGMTFNASDLLKSVLILFGEIWPARLTREGVSLGDVWEHPALGEKGSFESLVPFHKLSQWLTYSLIEVFEEAGFEVKNPQEMTGLPEYRNGGLLLDMGLIDLKDKEDYKKSHRPDSELIVEWRALTVTYLDKIGDVVRDKLGKSASEFPLAKVLEGGTWWAGRKIAKEKREDGSTPLSLASDGTVF